MRKTAVLLPLSRIVPPLYQFRVRSRVFRWYGRLREIEDTLETNPAGHPEMLKALDALEAQVEKISVPLSYADELHALRNHIQMVRRKLMRVQAGDAPLPAPAALVPDKVQSAS